MCQLSKSVITPRCSNVLLLTSTRRLGLNSGFSHQIQQGSILPAAAAARRELGNELMEIHFSLLDHHHRRPNTVHTTSTGWISVSPVPLIILAKLAANASPPQFVSLSSVRVVDPQQVPRADPNLNADDGWLSAVGISQRINPDDGQTPRICPRCNNGTPQISVLPSPPHFPGRKSHLPMCCGVRTRTPLHQNTSRYCYRIDFSIQSILTYAYIPVAVVSAKKKTYFELFCVPIFPMSSKHVWVCSICQWRVPLQQGYVLAFF